MRSKSVQNRFENWCELTSAHAVPDWHKAETKCGRVFWILVLIIFSVICIYEISTVLQSFISDDKYTTQIYYEPAQFLEFPAISVCYGIPWSKRAMKRLNMSVDALEFFSQSFLGPVNRTSVFNFSVMLQMRDAYEAWESSPEAKSYCIQSNCGKIL